MTSPVSGSRRPAVSSAAAVASGASLRTTVTARAGSVRRAHTPCSTRRRSRRAGWAATTAFAARWASANPVPSAAVTARACANRARDPPSSRCRRMIGVGISGPSSWAAGAGVAVRGALVAGWAASARGVRSRNTSRGAIAMPRARARLTTVMARMLSPPARKKSQSASTAAAGSVSVKMSTSAARAVSGDTAGVSCSAPAAPACSARSVRALRSSLPLTVSGRASAGSTRAGTMCAGSFAESRPVRSPGTRPTMWATRWSPLSATVTAASTTPSSSLIAASTSPGSMRKPLSCTWSSARPVNSSSPSSVRRARSPVWYMRAPPPANGSATKRPAVSPGRPR